VAISVFSRYFGLATVVVDDVASLAIRPQPAMPDFPDAIEHYIVAGETMDQLAFRYYGREDLWWRIADANPRMAPFALAPSSTPLIIPPPRVATRTPGR
jgi:nucleoid-associated protein YgaU